MARKYVLPTQATTLNGSSSSFTLPIIPSTTSFSIAFWYYAKTSANNNRVVDYQGAGPADGFTLTNTAVPGAINFRVNNGGSGICDISTGRLGYGKFYHVVVTYAVNSMKIYVDTSLKATDTAGTMTASAGTTLTVGRRATGASNFFNGNIFDFMFFNDKVLDQTEINNLFNSRTIPSGCTAYIKGEGDVLDYSGSGNNATASNLTYTKYLSTRHSASGRSAKALNFANSTTAVVTISDNVLIRPETTNVFTWCGWIYISNTKENVLPRIMEKGTHYTCIMGDQTNSMANRLVLEVTNDSNDVATEYWGSTSLNNNRRYFWVTTFNDGSCQHYIDCEAETMTTIGGPYVSPLKVSSSSSLLIGNTAGNSRNWGGSQSDVKFYNVILSQDEMRQIMGGIEVSRGLVGSWKMAEGTGTSVADTSGNNLHGTITAATWIDNTNTRTQSTSRTTSGSRAAV